MIRRILCAFGWHRWKPSKFYDAEEYCACCMAFRPAPYGEKR